jgi:RimJ/RimL family protein N-acetyltransferase
MVSLFDFNSCNRATEFGYGVIPPFRRQGVGKRMLAAAFDRFFPAMDFNKLYCQTDSFDTASVKLLVSLGMTRDAVLRDTMSRMVVFMTTTSSAFSEVSGRIGPQRQRGRRQRDAKPECLRKS